MVTIRRRNCARGCLACAGADGDFDTVVELLLGELAARKDDSLRLIDRVGLSGFFGIRWSASWLSCR